MKHAQNATGFTRNHSHIKQTSDCGLGSLEVRASDKEMANKQINQVEKKGLGTQR